MAKIATITNPLTGQPVQVDQLEHTAQQIDDGINIARGVSNPNLLDNWYFANPVNQRGVTSGTAGWNEYFLDRWHGYCIYDVTKGYLEVGSGSHPSQRIENGGSIPYPVTFSILFQDGTFGYQTVYADGGFSLIGANVKGDADSQIHGENPYISYNNNSGSTVGIIAVKLELGTTQTLAHQDENGNWVLNEIPNYQQELAKCQRYFVRYLNKASVSANIGSGIAYNATLFFCVLPLPVPMRTTPTFSMYGVNVSNERSIFTISNVAVKNMVANTVNLEITTSNLTTGYPYYIKLGGSGAYIDLSADL